jgi:hypothetical protein
VLHYVPGTLRIMSCVFSDVQIENIQKPVACDTTIYRGALKHCNNNGKAQTTRKVTVKVTTRHKW